MPAAHYCAIEDVNALVPQAPFTTSSKPTAASVTSWIDDVANDMDMVLGNIGYVTPVVAGALGLQWLKKTCALGVLGLAQAARDTGVTTSVNAGANEVKNIWQQMFEARMKAIANSQDPTELSDAPRTSEQLQKQPENVLRSMVQAGLTDIDFANPTVTRNQVL